MRRRTSTITSPAGDRGGRAPADVSLRAIQPWIVAAIACARRSSATCARCCSTGGSHGAPGGGSSGATGGHNSTNPAAPVRCARCWIGSDDTPSRDPRAARTRHRPWRAPLRSNGTTRRARRARIFPAPRARALEMIAHAREGRGIGALEAEDRLLRIADREDGALRLRAPIRPTKNSSASFSTTSHCSGLVSCASSMRMWSRPPSSLNSTQGGTPGPHRRSRAFKHQIVVVEQRARFLVAAIEREHAVAERGQSLRRPPEDRPRRGRSSTAAMRQPSASSVASACGAVSATALGREPFSVGPSA